MHRLLAPLLFALGVGTSAGAHVLSLQECLEGGDFIAHAAQARDNGMMKEEFLDGWWQISG